MTTNKDFKRLVRGRMLKTGESYTAARSNLIKTGRADRQAGGPKVRAPGARPDYAKLAGWTDDLIKAKTGCDWDRWVKALDYTKAYEWSHREIARHIHEKYQVPGWWTQTVTVGYERIKGLRAIGQRRDGAYEANKSRTYPVPLARLFRAFSDKRNRAKWLPGVDLTVRTSTKDKSMRISWPDGTSVVVGFLSKGNGKSSVQVQHGKLPDKATADKMKAFWGERLGALAEVLV
jgi:uncharacterized protein YndB with AHSA1/START domain